MFLEDKNNSIHKSKAQETHRETNLDKYRGAAHKILQNIILEKKNRFITSIKRGKKKTTNIFRLEYKDMLCLLHLT